MNIYILTGTDEITGIVESFESVIWNMQFYGKNDFQLVVPLSNPSAGLLTKGKYLVRDIDMSPGEYHNVMRIEDRSISFDADKGWLLQVSGGGLKKITAQRVIWDQINFIEESVETAIRTVITDNIISPSNADRAIPDFIMEEAQGFTDTFDGQFFGENIADWLESTCQLYGYGWDIYIKDHKYVFQLIRSTDRGYGQSQVPPVIFSPEFDNLASATYEDRGSEYFNVGLIGGEGEGTSQITTSVGSGTGLDRYEVYIDGGSVSSNGEIITMETYISMLQTYGLEQLTDTSLYQEISGEIIQNSVYEYGKDYFLGDKVQVDIGYASGKLQITEMIYSEDANGSKLVPTFGDQEV